MAQAEWIWYPDDFEIELSNRFMAERYERDVMIPPFWKTATCYQNVKFRKTFDLSREEYVKITTEGVFNVMMDGAYLYSVKSGFSVPAGRHEIVVSVYNGNGLPCLKLEGETIVTDGDWEVTCNDHVMKKAGCDGEFLSGNTPNTFRLPSREVFPKKTIPFPGGIVYDFGEEMFARVKLTDAVFGENPRVYYGESFAEATDPENCELISEDFEEKEGYVTVSIAKAFRYVVTENLSFSSLSAFAELSPGRCRSSFVCDNEEINAVYKVAERTMELCSREFILDGIKRDRWLWGADVYQSSLMHYYSFFDTKSIKRSMIALFGKSPFNLYINHIMDYSFFWIICFDDYLTHSGDEKFGRENCGKAFEILDYCLGRRDENGLMDSRPDDWVFVDWADLDNTGEVCCEQMLLVVALKRCVGLAAKFGYPEKETEYAEILKETEKKLEKFWLPEKNAYTYSYKNGKPDNKILMHPNIFAVLFDLCGEERKKAICGNVLKNPSVPKIVTPYMRFYELSALCRLGDTRYVTEEIGKYWGAMIKEGATTFWERYDSEEKGDEKYAMYGRKYGKSLCHAWGATPLYLLGRYVVGLKAADDAKSFTIAPDLAGLKWFRAEMPLVKGCVKAEADEKKIRVYSSELGGVLIAGDRRYPVRPGEWTEVAR